MYSIDIISGVDYRKQKRILTTLTMKVVSGQITENTLIFTQKLALWIFVDDKKWIDTVIFNVWNALGQLSQKSNK